MGESLYDLVIMRKRKVEQLFCAGVLVNPLGAQRECGWLAPDTFVDERYRRFWSGVKDGRDPVGVAEEVGILDEIAQKTTSIVSAFAYRDLARVVAEDFYYLNLAKMLPDLARAIGARNRDRVRSVIDNIKSDMPLVDDQIPTALDVAFDFDKWLNNECKIIFTGIPPLDRALGGLDVPTLTLIAARPSMGKTTLGFQIARNLAAAGRRVIFFSLEMSARQLWSRAACGSLGIALKLVRTGSLSDDQIDLLRQQSLELAARYEDRLLIDDCPNNTSESIWMKVARYKPDVILVDHTSLVCDQADREVYRLGKITNAGKKIAKEFGLAAIYLQQLNRDVERRDNKRPTMADLRDSGELEQNADNVIFLYRDDYYDLPAYNKRSDVSTTELIVAKARDGERNISVKVEFHFKRQWFYSPGESYE